MKNKFKIILSMLVILGLLTVSYIKQKELIILIHTYDKYNWSTSGFWKIRRLPWGINKLEAKILLGDETIIPLDKQIAVYDHIYGNGPPKITYFFNKNNKLFRDSITYQANASNRYNVPLSLKDHQYNIFNAEVPKELWCSYQEVLRSFTWREGSEIKSEEGESVLETIENDPWDKEFYDETLLNKDFAYKEVYMYEKIRIEITTKKEGALIYSTIETTNLKLEPKLID